ncbi:hypothetical protein ACJX0J_018158, partial [Zea mays]
LSIILLIELSTCIHLLYFILLDRGSAFPKHVCCDYGYFPPFFLKDEGKIILDLLYKILLFTIYDGFGKYIDTLRNTLMKHN